MKTHCFVTRRLCVCVFVFLFSRVCSGWGSDGKKKLLSHTVFSINPSGFHNILNQNVIMVVRVCASLTAVNQITSAQSGCNGKVSFSNNNKKYLSTNLTSDLLLIS